ncbi:hypothetical protein DH2020_038776 [Rehmannia glutinosa]|uniref:Uncharacterized protein n=1 Tax=Rehmannia glutinosa TaxID=99300 RepID=A0ABR0V099_REHGL
MESWKQKTNYNQKPSLIRSKLANEPCKKHPKHTQSPGVCSICLSEKLSKLSNTNNKKSGKSQFSSYSSSYLSSMSSSYDASYNSSPNIKLNMRVFRKNDTILSGQEMFMKKSKSMAFALQRRKEEEKNVETKRGFWSKLLPRKNKKNYVNEAQNNGSCSFACILHKYDISRNVVIYGLEA